MTDYLLANGTNKAPAVQAPAHMAAWLEARGYCIVRCPGLGPADPGDFDLVARPTAPLNSGEGPPPARDDTQSTPTDPSPEWNP